VPKRRAAAAAPAAFSVVEEGLLQRIPRHSGSRAGGGGVGGGRALHNNSNNNMPALPSSTLTAAARKRTAALVNLAMVVEQANEQMLPAVYLFVGTSLSATPSQLGTLTLCRALVQTLSSPLSGVLGDRSDRRLVLAAGAFIWGVMTSAIALSTSLRVAMFFAAVNGLGLALLVPCCQSLVADLHPPEHRGRAFGLMQLTGALGGMAGSVFATNVGAANTLATWGIEGWRLAFHAVAGLSVLMGAFVLGEGECNELY
jgi:MFS family permease